MTGRVRFAAAAAPLRLDRARLALLAWQASRKAGVPFLLRLRGAAPPPELAWLGVVADETVRAADRAAAHAAAAARLVAAGRLYPCFETEDELRWKREQQLRRNRPPVYDRAMLALSAAQRASAEAGGKRPYWRFLLDGREVSWRDRAAGTVAVRLATLSDPVVVAADGAVSAGFAAAVDDAEQGVGLLLRDSTRLEASAVQLDIMAALGADTGGLRLMHVVPMPAALASMPVRRLRQDGVEPRALGGFLTDTGGFALPRLWRLNRAALAALPFSAVAGRLPDGADAAFWAAVRGGIDLLSEAHRWWEVVGDRFVAPVPDRALLLRARQSLPPEPWDTATWPAWAEAVGDAAGLRLLLTGEEAGPDMAALLPLIGPARVRARLAG